MTEKRLWRGKVDYPSMDLASLNREASYYLHKLIDAIQKDIPLETITHDVKYIKIE